MVQPEKAHGRAGVVPDRQEVWLAARQLIDRHGEFAPLYAMHSVDRLIERGDFRLAACWRSVCRAVDSLLAEAPGGGH